jgi:hypothetical protein
MGMEFGWWATDEEVGKYQVVVEFHGGKVIWTRKHGHHIPWAQYFPVDEDWDRLLAEVDRRVPRRLLSPRQYNDLKKICLERGPCEKFVPKVPRRPGSK